MRCKELAHRCNSAILNYTTTVMVGSFTEEIIRTGSFRVSLLRTSVISFRESRHITIYKNHNIYCKFKVIR